MNFKARLLSICVLMQSSPTPLKAYFSEFSYPNPTDRNAFLFTGGLAIGAISLTSAIKLINLISEKRELAQALQQLQEKVSLKEKEKYDAQQSELRKAIEIMNKGSQRQVLDKDLNAQPEKRIEALRKKYQRERAELFGEQDNAIEPSSEERDLEINREYLERQVLLYIQRLRQERDRINSVLQGFEQQPEAPKIKEVIIPQPIIDWAGPLPDALELLVTQNEHAEKFEKFNVSPGHGYLLYGPPGTGKTFLAEVLAARMKLPLIKTSSGEFITKFQGSGNEHLTALLKEAHEYPIQPGHFFSCMIFIDEIDGIGSRSGGGFNREETRLVEGLLAAITDPKNKHILFVGASNLINNVDVALTRPGRLVPIYVGYPDKTARKAIIEAYAQHFNIPSGTLNSDALSEITEGLSSAAIEYALRSSILKFIRDESIPLTQLITEAFAQTSKASPPKEEMPTGKIDIEGLNELIKQLVKARATVE